MRSPSRSPATIAAFLVALAVPASSQTAFKLSKINGGVGIEPEAGGGYGRAICSLGDLEGDGVEDLAVGEPFRDDGGEDAGAVWIHFRRADGTVRQSRRISETEGGIQGLVAGDAFGTSLAAAGDRNGDGVMDLFVGAPASDGRGRTGRVFLLYLAADGSVLGQISVGDSLPASALIANTTFGESVCAIDDVNGDGVGDLAIAGTASYASIDFDLDGIWIVFLDATGSAIGVTRTEAVDFIEGGYIRSLVGRSLVSPGDLDGDGIPELVLGDPDTHYFFLLEELFGYVHTVFLRADGGVKSARSARPSLPPFTSAEDDPAEGIGAQLLVTVDGDQNGFPDILASTGNAQTFFVLSLNAAGFLKRDTFVEPLVPFDAGDQFGAGMASLSDQDGDGLLGLALGAPGDDDGGLDRGAVWILAEGSGDGIPNSPSNPVASERRIRSSLLTDTFGEPLSVPIGDLNEGAVVSLGDIDGDGTPDLAWGLPGEETEGQNAGVVFLLFMNPDASVRDVARLTRAEATAGLAIPNAIREFGSTVAAAGDRDGNGVPDLLVRAFERISNQLWGGYFVVNLGADGSVLGSSWVRPGLGGFQPPWVGPAQADAFASSLVALGDLDGDGRGEIAVSSSLENNTDGNARGAIYVLFTNPDESIASFRRLKLGKHGLPAIPPSISNLPRLGEFLTTVSDLNGDGRRELVATLPSGAPPGAGALVIFLASNGVPTAHQRLSPEEGLTLFGTPSDGLAVLDDLDGDGREELVVESAGWGHLLDLGAGAVVEEEFLLSSEGFTVASGLRHGVASLDVDADGLPEIITRAPAGAASLGLPYDLFWMELALPDPQVPHGCPNTVAGSLELSTPSAVIGEPVSIALDNPAGTQSGPALPILFFGTSRLACGSAPIPGWGMGVPGSPGELLVQPMDPLLYFVGPSWDGSGPVAFDFEVPHDSGLVGGRAYLQGLLWEPAGSQGVEFALTEAVELEVRLPLSN